MEVMTSKYQKYNTQKQYADNLNLSSSAISQRRKRTGSIEGRDTETAQFLRSGKLGKPYFSGKQARAELGITTRWVSLMTRLEQGYDLEVAKDDATFKAYVESVKDREIVRFREPIEIFDKTYTNYGDVLRDFENDPNVDFIVKPQTIRKNWLAGKTGYALITGQKRSAKGTKHAD